MAFALPSGAPVTLPFWPTIAIGVPGVSNSLRATPLFIDGRTCGLEIGTVSDRGGSFCRPMTTQPLPRLQGVTCAPAQEVGGAWHGIFDETTRASPGLK